MTNVLFISDQSSGQRPNYLATLQNIKKYFEKKNPEVQGWKQTWGMFDPKTNLKIYKNFLYKNVSVKNQSKTTKSSEKKEFETWNNLDAESKKKILEEIDQGCKELLDYIIEQRKNSESYDLRLIFLDSNGMDLFVKYLLDNKFEPYDTDESNIQKETIEHFFDLTYYSLHGKLLVFKRDNLILKLGRTLPLISFALEGREQPLAEALSFLLNDITHLIKDTKPQIIEKPKNENNSWNWPSYYIDSIEKFDDFYNKLIDSKVVCIDTETSNLNKINNKILTMHFSLTGEEAYNIPYLHRETPFCTEELEYIKKKMKYYFEFGKSDYLIFHNAKFDLSVFRGTFGVEYFNHKIYDTMYGCYAIDENRKFIKDSFPLLSYGLGHLAEEYGCLAYSEGELGKEDRSNMEEHSLVSIMQYASKDVVIPYKIHRFQEEEAELLGFKEFKNFVLNILGVIGTVFCDIELNGLLLDINYSDSLLQPDGVLMNIRNNLLLKAFGESENCKKTNKLLHINESIRDNLNELQKVIKKVLRTRGIKERVSEELKETAEKFVEYVDSLLRPNSELTKNLTLYKNINNCFCDKDGNLKSKIQWMFDEFQKLVESSTEIAVEDALN